MAGPVREQISGVLRQFGAADRALYAAIAAAPVPALDKPLRGLSGAANYSRIWLIIAAGLAVFGGPAGRRAAVRGIVSVGVCSVLVNLGIKSLYVRPRPDRSGLRVPASRQVRMPASTSFPSGHSASGFAFAAGVSRELPRLGPPLRALAAAVAYSRVHTGVHYPADALAGSIVGVGTGRAVTRLTDHWRARRAAHA